MRYSDVVFAVNKLGQGPAAMASPPYVIPMPQKPGAPLNFSLMVLDGTSLRASFSAPAFDVGDEIDKYRVEYATEEFVDEVQAVRVQVTATTEVKTVTTSAKVMPEVQLVHAKLGDRCYPSGCATTTYEQQAVRCDATGGFFALTFDGLATSLISHDASLADVRAEIGRAHV